MKKAYDDEFDDEDACEKDWEKCCPTNKKEIRKRLRMTRKLFK